MSNRRADAAQRAAALAVVNRALDDGRISTVEYDSRVVAIGTATYVAEVAAQAEQFGWQPPPPTRGIAPYGRIALVLGVLSVLFAPCLVGLIPGALAVLYSVRATGAGDTGFGAAMIGRSAGILGVVLSLTATAVLIYALTHSLGP